MHSLGSVSLFAMLLALGIALAHAQPAGSSSGKIVCWKDKSGKVVGCGDKVPPEFQDNAANVLNKQGITVKQSDAALTPEQKKAQQAELERKKIEAEKRERQQRTDRMLLDSYTTVQEIDLKRNRDIQLIDSNIKTLQTNFKNANDRQAESHSRIEQLNKNKQAVPPAVQEEYDRIEGDKAKIQNQIDQKRKEIVEKNEYYDAQKKRFNEIKGVDAGSGAKSASAPATSAPPAKK